MSTSKPIKVYFAGPISKHGWRGQIVPELHGSFLSVDEEAEFARTTVDYAIPTITRGVTCIGPWFVRCDHGCFHRPDKHGVIGYCMDEEEPVHARQQVFISDRERIRQADAVFAYIDRAEAYGTAIEIGFAHALGKPVLVGFPPGAPWREDMWFAAQASVGNQRGYVGSVEEVWEQFNRTVVTCLRARRPSDEIEYDPISKKFS